MALAMYQYPLLKATFLCLKMPFKDHIKPDFPIISDHISYLAWPDPLSLSTLSVPAY